MSRSLALAMGSPVSTIPQNDFRTSWKTNRTNSALAQEKTFSSLLNDSIGDGIRGALGQAILGVLTDQGLFDRASNPKEFQIKLQSVFENGEFDRRRRPRSRELGYSEDEEDWSCRGFALRPCEGPGGLGRHRETSQESRRSREN